MSEGEKKLRSYLRHSAGNCNHPTLHTLRCIVGMVQTGEVSLATVKNVGGDWLSEQLTDAAKANGWGAVEWDRY